MTTRSKERVELGTWVRLLAVGAFLALILGLTGSRAQAHETPADRAIGKAYQKPLRIYDGDRHTPGMQRLLRDRSPALNRLQRQTKSEWRPVWNEQFHRPRTILIDAAPMLDGQIGLEELPGLAEEVLRSSQELLGVSPEQLELFRVKPIKNLRIVTYLQVHNGLRVNPSFVNVVFFQRKDKLVLSRIDSEVFPELDLPTEPHLTPDDAELLAIDHIGFPQARAEATPRLQISPAPRADGKGVEPSLVYTMRVPVEEPLGIFQVLIDAHTGDTIAAYDTIRYMDYSGNVAGFATPGLAPDSGANPPTLQPLKGLTVTIPGVGSAVTDENGDFSIPSTSTATVTATLSLQGPFANANNAAGADLTVTTSITPGTPADIVFNPTPNQLTTAQVNGFIHTNVVHDFIKTIDPTFTQLDLSMPCNCNLNDNCNAFFNGSSINFFTSGGGCVNSAYSTVVYHEYGHAIVNQIYPFFVDGAFNEGISDVTAAYLVDDPNLGSGFSGGPFLRNVDVQDRVYPADVNNPIHDAGLIVGGAFWDTLTAMKNSVGVPQALDLCRDYYLFHMFLLTGDINPILTMDVLMIDDDDGSILNGTPHYAEINQGFSAHGLDAPALQFFDVTHSELADTTNDIFDYDVVATILGTITDVASVELVYRTDSTGFSSVPMTPTGNPNEYMGSIPAAPSPARVSYYFAMTNIDGVSANFPLAAPNGTIDFFVGQVTELFVDPVQTDNGWTSVQVATQNDWQRGVPNQTQNNQWDPFSAASPPFVWGNDLSPPPNFNGNYQPNVSNYIESVGIDCTGHTNVWFQMNRWLTVESGQYDVAQLLIGGGNFFTNPFSTDFIDDSWVPVTYNISSVAANNPNVRIRFSLTSDGGVEFGGWNFDDIRVVSVSQSNPDVFALQQPTANVAPGVPTSLPIEGRYDQDLSGFSVSSSFDPATLQVTDATFAGTAVDAVNADFSVTDFDNVAGWVTALVIVDATLVNTLPSTMSSDLVWITYEADASAPIGTTTTLEFEDGLGTNPIDNVMSLADASTVSPFLVSGVLTIDAPGGPIFLRGDVNGDSSINLPDAVTALVYLFTQGPAPGCLDAIDIDDDGNLDITDPVDLLNFLFVSGPAPLAPFPSPGVDPTPDAVSCLTP